MLSKRRNVVNKHGSEKASSQRWLQVAIPKNVPSNLEDKTSVLVLSEMAMPAGLACHHTNSTLCPPESDKIKRSSDAGGYLQLNIGGVSVRLKTSNALAYPNTLLSQFAQSDHETKLRLCDGYIDGAYFFDRSPIIFDAILGLYRCGRLHISPFVCLTAMLAEMEFWKIDTQSLSSCCLSDSFLNILRTQNYVVTEGSGPPIGEKVSTSKQSCDETGILSETGIGCSSADYEGKSCSKVRKALWTFLEVPTSSTWAMVFMVISCGFVLLTVVALVLSSMPQFRTVDQNTNVTKTDESLEWVDTSCVAWFTFEYVSRLWAAPHRWIYVKCGLSIIDLVAIFPFYLELLLNQLGFENKTFGDIRRSLLLVRFLRVLRILRVLRVLKVARYSRGFQSMGRTLKNSWKELVLLVMFILTTNLIFSTAMYFIEEGDPRTFFESIPSASWWCIITMTTVGYGDVYPVTVCGKILAGLVSISGIILLAFPISVIVDNFNQCYYEDKTMEEPVLSMQPDLVEESQVKPTSPSHESAHGSPIAPSPMSNNSGNGSNRYSLNRRSNGLWASR